MRSIVSIDDYNESDIKPQAELHTYVELMEADVRKYFLENCVLNACTCPGCSEAGVGTSFMKFGLPYAECANCGTLYVATRPSDESIREYYTNSESRKFWRTKLATVSQDKRREKIVKPRFQWIEDSVMECCPQASHAVIMGADGPILRSQFGDLAGFDKHTMFDTYCSEPEERRGINVLPLDQESSLAGDVDVVALFEVADRTSDVDGLFLRINTMLKPGGLCFMTDILASGFDIMTLWEHAENITPPDRLNVFTIKGLESLFARHDFTVIELSTPGVLDVEIVASYLKKEPGMSVSRFVRRLALEGNHYEKMKFQQFLQVNLLSSYGRILLQKKSR